MTTPEQVAGATQQAAGETASAAKHEVVDTAQVAKSAAGDVVGTAKEQVSNVAGEAINQVRQLTDQAREQATQQAANATDKLGESVRRLASEVRDMAQGNGQPGGTVANLAHQLADKGEQFAEYVSRQGPGGLAQELRAFAGRKPGSFLLGAIAAGMVAGRVVKGVTASNDSSQQPSSSYKPSMPLVAADPYPVATSSYGLTDDESYLEPDPTFGSLPNGEQHVLDTEFGRTTYTPDRGV